MFEFVLGAAILALLFAVANGVAVLRIPAGTDKMKNIAAAIKEGAGAYLNRQYKTVSIFVIIIAVAMYIVLGPAAGISFVAGAVLSALAGYIGMMMSVRANVRTAHAATKGVAA